MISMLVVGLIVSGSVYTIARANKLQYQAAIRAQVVDQLRALVMSQGVSLCGTTQSLTAVGSTTVNASFSCQPYSGVSVTLPGANSAIATTIGSSQAQMVTATVQSALLGSSLSVSSGAKDNGS